MPDKKQLKGGKKIILTRLRGQLCPWQWKAACSHQAGSKSRESRLCSAYFPLREVISPTYRESLASHFPSCLETPSQLSWQLEFVVTEQAAYLSYGVLLTVNIIYLTINTFLKIAYWNFAAKRYCLHLNLVPSFITPYPSTFLAC